MSDPGPITLEAALEGAAAELEAVERRATAGGVEWSIGGRAFAVLDRGSAAFRLDPAVARAALGTPDTTPSPRGADWVAFQPARLDGPALDRATAWLASAWRRADGEG